MFQVALNEWGKWNVYSVGHHTMVRLDPGTQEDGCFTAGEAVQFAYDMWRNQGRISRPEAFTCVVRAGGK